MKGQQDVISALLIIVISIGLVSSAILYGMPLIQKRQEETLVSRVSNYFNPSNPNSLPSRLEYISKNGGSERFSIGTKGLWEVNATENSLSFTLWTKYVSDKGLDRWIGKECDAEEGFRGDIGVVGVNSPFVICSRATYEGGYIITYKIWSRELWTEDGSKGYLIKFSVPETSPSSSATSSIELIFKDKRGEKVDGKTLIITEIEILLR